jgi:hypothetical protein
MAATPQPPWTAPPPARWGAGRVIAVVLGALLLLPALGLLAGGGVLLWADGPGRADDGYLMSAQDSFSTSGYAMTSERIDLTTGANWVPLSSTLGTARIEVSSPHDVFIGIAPVTEGRAYLDGVERTVIADLGAGSAPADQRLVPGGPPSGAPTDQDFWVAQARGTGTQNLSWKPADGNWLLVVMNADGSSGVSVDARIGATAPALGGLAWGILGGGLFLLLVAVLVLVLALRSRPAGYVGPYGGAPVPAGPPPYWTPPAPVDRNTAPDNRSAPDARTAGDDRAGGDVAPSGPANG